eukprot:g8423.t1
MSQKLDHITNKRPTATSAAAWASCMSAQPNPTSKFTPSSRATSKSKSSRQRDEPFPWLHPKRQGPVALLSISRLVLIFLLIRQWWIVKEEWLLGLSLLCASLCSIGQQLAASITFRDRAMVLKAAPRPRGFFVLWWLHLAGTPYFLHGYYTLLGQYPAWLRVALFPLNVWLVQVAEGYITIFLFGRHVVWRYKESDALFHGNIRLSQVWRHWLLGVLVELTYQPLLMPLAHTIGPWSFQIPHICIPIMLYLSPSVGSTLHRIPSGLGLASNSDQQAVS